jgi:hypothetical protein
VAYRYFKRQFELLEPRALLSHLNLEAMPAAALTERGRSSALLGSIQGLETPTSQGWQFEGTGTVQPLGEVSVTGFLGYGPPHGKGGAVNGTGTLTFSNDQGTLTLSMKSHGYFPLRSQNAEEIRVTVQVRSGSRTYAGTHVAGTINLVNPFTRTVVGAHPSVPFSAEISLKPNK